MNYDVVIGCNVLITFLISDMIPRVFRELADNPNRGMFDRRRGMMKKATGASVLLLLLFSWVLTDAQATTSQVSPPVSVVEGNLESDTNIFWFFEGQTTLGR